MDNSQRQGLHNLVAPRGARRNKKRLGRGESSHGKTSGRGNKGQKARKSGQVRPGFEGGSLPLARRLPKRGFNNKDFASQYAIVNVGRLAERFSAGATVDAVALLENGLLAKANVKVKVLGEGDVGHALTLKVHKISAQAREKIEKAGGSVEVLASTGTKA
ncbi:MAG: 50S ribosomal protein L15 [Myxococcota bacterium]